MASSNQAEMLKRAEATFDDLHDLANGFVVKSRAFHRQYASLYFIRLHHLRPAIIEQATQRWGNQADKPRHVEKVLDVTSKRCFIVGTVYVDMQLKPNVLRDLSKESSISSTDIPRKYKGTEDKVSVEDESGRVQLVGAILEKEVWVTGMVVGLLGKETAEGTFEIQEVCYPGMAPQERLPQNDNSKYVALVSGLNIGQEDTSELKLQMLTEYLTGELGTTDVQRSSSNIARVIIAGNSIGKKQLIEDDKKVKKYGYDSTRYDAGPLTQFDEFLEELCASVPVDVMPGEKDPANRQLPQQPLPQSLFTKARQTGGLRNVTNPYWSKVNDVSFLGTSGQNVNDIFRYVDENDPLKTAEASLFWQHIAPSAPDTLWCYPFQEHDPFLLKTTPHVYFVGNQQQFEQSVVEGSLGQKARVVLVPSFAKTGSIVLVNLGTLECTEVRIEV